MALTNIEYGSIATSKVLNDNFNYLEEKIEDYSKNIATDKASLISLINSQIETVNVQFTAKLQAIYPVGSIYIGTTDNCPIASVFGTWEKVSEGRVLQGASSSQTAGKTVEAGLPNIKGSFYTATFSRDVVNDITQSGALYCGNKVSKAGHGSQAGANTRQGLDFDASRSNAIYGKSTTVQPPAYLVNIWRRTA
jgi:hypothetical protein